MKKYIAKTNVSVNVILSSGANCHVSFDAITGGGSVYYTEDEEVMKALEKHYKYGKLFRLDPDYSQNSSTNKRGLKNGPINESAAHPTRSAEIESIEESVDITETEPSTVANSTNNAEENNGLKTVSVSDPDDAKAYLAEHFGLSRTKIKSLKAINAAAAANGIVFEGL